MFRQLDIRAVDKLIYSYLILQSTDDKNDGNNSKSDKSDGYGRPYIHMCMERWVTATK